jgi:hypothetical protein
MGEIGKGGCEETIYCLSLTQETCRFTVPPAIAFLNYIRSDTLSRISPKTGIFHGVSSISNLISREISAKLQWSVRGASSAPC